MKGEAVPVKAMTEYRESGGACPLILNFDTMSRCVVSLAASLQPAWMCRRTEQSVAPTGNRSPKHSARSLGTIQTTLTRMKVVAPSLFERKVLLLNCTQFRRQSFICSSVNYEVT